MPARLAPLNGGAPIQLDKPIILIGRHPDCDVVIANSGKVSRRHCCVAQINGTHRIRDLGSMNGIRVNGTRVTEAVLAINDQVGIGDVIFAFQLDAAAPQRPAAPPQAIDATLPPSVEAPFAPESFAPQQPQPAPHYPAPPPPPAPAYNPYPQPPAPQARPPQYAPQPAAYAPPAPAYNPAPQYQPAPIPAAPVPAAPQYQPPPRFEQPVAPPAASPHPVELPPVPGYGSSPIPPPPSYSVPYLPAEWSALPDAPRPDVSRPAQASVPAVSPSVPAAPPARYAPPPAAAPHAAPVSHHAAAGQGPATVPPAPIPLHPGQPARSEYASPHSPPAPPPPVPTPSVPHPPAPPAYSEPPQFEPAAQYGTVVSFPGPPVPSAEEPRASVRFTLPAPPVHDEHHDNRGTVAGAQFPAPPQPPSPLAPRGVPQDFAAAVTPPAPPAAVAPVQWSPPPSPPVPPAPPSVPMAAPSGRSAYDDGLPPMPPLPLEKPITATQFGRSSIAGAGHPSLYREQSPGFVSAPLVPGYVDDPSGPPSLEIPVAIDEPYPDIPPMPKWTNDPSSVQPAVRPQPSAPEGDIRLKDID